MKLLPLFLKLKFRHRTWGIPTLWLPIFLLWPVVFLLGTIFFLVGLIALVILDTRSIGRFCCLFSGIYRTFCELRGTRIDVEDRENRVLILIH